MPLGEDLCCDEGQLGLASRREAVTIGPTPSTEPFAPMVMGFFN